MLSPGVAPTRPVAAQGSTLAGPEETSAPLVTPTRYYPTSSPLRTPVSEAGRLCADTAALLMFCTAQQPVQRCRAECCVGSELCRTMQDAPVPDDGRGAFCICGVSTNVTPCLIRHLHHPTRPNFQTPMQSKLPFFRRIRYGQ